MSEDSVFLGENTLVASCCGDVINIAIDGSDSFEVINLGNTLSPSEILRTSLCVVHCRRELVLFMRDYVVRNTVQIVRSGEGRCFGAPRVGRSRVLLIL